MLIFIAFFLFGVTLTLFSIGLLFKRRLLFATVNGTIGFSLLSISISLALILLNVHTYHQLTSEQKLAVVQIGYAVDDRIPIQIQADGQAQTYFIQSKEWQIDARFLKWKSWAYLLGSEPVVRLESLRERRPFETNAPAVSYDLVGQYPVLANLGSTLSDWFGIVDSYFGSSVYMPAAEGSTYAVSATISGLIVRAENAEARRAVTAWMSQ